MRMGNRQVPMQDEVQYLMASSIDSRYPELKQLCFVYFAFYRVTRAPITIPQSIVIYITDKESAMDFPTYDFLSIKQDHPSGADRPHGTHETACGIEIFRTYTRRM